MFGENWDGESPRLPSPWLARSAGSSPSPLSLNSIPSTPEDALSAQHTLVRRQSSLEHLALLDGLGEDFDSLSLSSGRKRSLSSSPPGAGVGDEPVPLGALQPEVDHQGHIEYKLKLLAPTSLHRLEKLRTQLKWRLTEGGGVAVYELGLLDDGKIVGLERAEMEESLRTLGRMLAGLGGGRVQVERVLRIGGARAEESSGGEDSPPPPFSAPSPTSSTFFPSFDVPPSTSDLSYIDYLRSTPSPSSLSLSSSTPPSDAQVEPAPFFPPDKPKGPTPFPSGRSAEEQAVFRRDKRDQRRARREAATAAAEAARGGDRGGSSPSSSSGSPSPAPSSSTASPNLPASSPIPISSIPSSRPGRPFNTLPPRPVSPRPKPPKPPKPPRAQRTPPALPSSTHPEKRERHRLKEELAKEKLRQAKAAGALAYRPKTAREGEERWVVEAVVHKGVFGEALDPAAEAVGGAGAGTGGRRRKSSAARRSPTRIAVGEVSEDALSTATEDDDPDLDVNEDEDDEDSPVEEEEGWTHLSFDLGELSSSVRSAAAAAAASAAVGA
ncbi:hypothetical protein JCM8097_007476 [Rhodosporidiobolus ruineniae]